VALLDSERGTAFETEQEAFALAPHGCHAFAGKVLAGLFDKAVYYYCDV
jgi:hypothetical protein